MHTNQNKSSTCNTLGHSGLGRASARQWSNFSPCVARTPQRSQLCVIIVCAIFGKPPNVVCLQCKHKICPRSHLKLTPRRRAPGKHLSIQKFFRWGAGLQSGWGIWRSQGTYYFACQSAVLGNIGGCQHECSQIMQLQNRAPQNQLILYRGPNHRNARGAHTEIHANLCQPNSHTTFMP